MAYNPDYPTQLNDQLTGLSDDDKAKVYQSVTTSGDPSTVNYYHQTDGKTGVTYNQIPDPNGQSSSNSTNLYIGNQDTSATFNDFGSTNHTDAMGSGDDAVYANGSGQANAFMGDGNDTVYYAAGAGATIDSGAGNDDVTLEPGLAPYNTGPVTALQVNLGSGDNTAVDISGGTNTITGGDDGNHIYVSAGSHDSITTGSGADYFVVGDSTTDTASATIDAGAGDDTIVAYSGADTLMGGDGNDLIEYFGAGNSSIDGGTGNDNIQIASGVGAGNTITGGTGDDAITLFGGVGSSTIDGGSGDNTLNLLGRSYGDGSEVSTNTNTGVTTITFSDATYTVSNTQTVNFGGDGKSVHLT